MPSETAEKLAAKFLAEADAATLAAAQVVPTAEAVVIVISRGGHDAAVVISDRGTTTLTLDGAYHGHYHPQSFRLLLDDIRHHLSQLTAAPYSAEDTYVADVAAKLDADTAETVSAEVLLAADFDILTASRDTFLRRNLRHILEGRPAEVTDTADAPAAENTAAAETETAEDRI